MKSNSYKIKYGPMTRRRAQRDAIFEKKVFKKERIIVKNERELPFFHPFLPLNESERRRIKAFQKRS